MIREKLQNGEVSIGSWMHLPSSDVAEMMGDAGFDWVAVDMEHGSISAQELPNLFRAITLGGTTPLCRIRIPEADLAVQALEAGAEGIIVPNTLDAYMLQEIKQSMHYPPTGLRGLGYSRGNGYGKYVQQQLMMKPLLIPIVENVSAIPELGHICNLGVDAVFIGPYDLSASLGKAGDFECAPFKEAIESIKFFCKQHNTPLGIHTVFPDKQLLNDRIKEGFQFISYSADIVMLQDHLQSWNALLDQGDPTYNAS